MRKRRLSKTRTPKKPPRPKLSTLCWCCAKATTGGCSWSRSFIPVEGWEATSTIIKEGALLKKDENGNITRDTTPRLSHSYKVHSCPEFVEDCKPDELSMVRGPAKSNKDKSII